MCLCAHFWHPHTKTLEFHKEAGHKGDSITPLHQHLAELWLCSPAPVPHCPVAPRLPVCYAAKVPLHCHLSRRDRWVTAHDWPVTKEHAASTLFLSWRPCARPFFCVVFKPFHLIHFTPFPLPLTMSPSPLDPSLHLLASSRSYWNFQVIHLRSWSFLPH